MEVIEDFELHIRKGVKSVSIFYKNKNKKEIEVEKILTAYAPAGVVISYYINPFYLQKNTGHFIKNVCWHLKSKQVCFKGELKDDVKKLITQFVNENINEWLKQLKGELK